MIKHKHTIGVIANELVQEQDWVVKLEQLAEATKEERKRTNLIANYINKFDFCPKCGQKINWPENIDESEMEEIRKLHIKRLLKQPLYEMFLLGVKAATNKDTISDFDGICPFRGDENSKEFKAWHQGYNSGINRLDVARSNIYMDFERIARDLGEIG
jgi:hypothetical protein